ncbi:MAG: hypothetical protein QXX55_00450 [Candidatus Pacearchaeota archaeon]
MVEKNTNTKIDVNSIAYMLGVLSIVFAFFQPFAALVLGIIGLIQSNKTKYEKAKKFNTIGIILAIVFIIISIVIFVTPLLGNFENLFPAP